MRLSTLAMVAPVMAIDISVIWTHDKPSGTVSLSILDTNEQLIAQSCSSVVDGPSKVDFSTVDEHGFGNFSIDGTSYFSHQLPEYSGGPVCTKKFNDVAAVLDCQGLSWNAPEDPVVETDCHGSEESKKWISHMTARNAMPGMEANEVAGNLPIEKRNPQIVCTTSDNTVKVGDGFPHQNYHKQQISENIYCGSSPSCSVGHEQSTSFTVGWTASASANGWIDAGFEVQESWSSGNQYTCYGSAGDELCIWYNTAHTAYTVQNNHYNSCKHPSNERYGDAFVMFSPNQQNAGGGYYCVIGTCRNKGDWYMDKDGPAGGPP
ncbi:hypothetical protein BDW02DRAFT_609111 [Decorospora gaudefroyi]|uniref:Uncharacterized protein n=1 Tax=Decorospora gaudefroyi TaxID=184978 RepID=A0A6A5K2J1_9PLEO|nr:hypothetical protein BDW02DRAFT_609111 [Decorospora gaudefroyi]